MKSTIRHCNSFPREGLFKKACSGSALAPALGAQRPECPHQRQERAGSPARSRMHSPWGPETATLLLCPAFSTAQGLPGLSFWGLFRPLAYCPHPSKPQYCCLLSYCQVMCCTFAKYLHSSPRWSNCNNFLNDFPKTGQ